MDDSPKDPKIAGQPETCAIKHGKAIARLLSKLLCPEE